MTTIPASSLSIGHWIYRHGGNMQVTHIDDFELSDGVVLVEITLAGRFVGIFEPDEQVEVSNG